MNEQLKARLDALPDAVFHTRDERSTLLLPNELMRSGYKGLWLGAARSLPMTPDARLNALLVHSGDEPGDGDARIGDGLVVVASDVDRGLVQAGPGFQGNDDKVEPAAEKEAPSIDEPKVVRAGATANRTSGKVWLDYGALLALPPQPARYALRAISFDQVSNPAYVGLGTSTNPAAPMTVDAALAVVNQLRADGQSEHRLPVFFRGDDTPTLVAPGIDFTLIKATDHPLPLHAALRIDVPAGSIVTRTASDATPAGTRVPSAILRATVLVVVKNQGRPFVIPVQIPLFLDRELKAGEVVDAAFSIDLARWLGSRPLRDSARVYVLSGRYISAPQMLNRR